MSALTVADLCARVRAFIDERDWAKFHSPKNLSMSIAIEAGELMECFQWQSEAETSHDMRHNGPPPEAVDELADVIIYCIALSNAMGIDDLGDAVLDKLARSGAKYPVEDFQGRFK